MSEESYPGLALHDILSDRSISLLMILLTVLIGTSGLTLLYQQPSIEVVSKDYPLGFLQRLPTIFWITTGVYAILGCLIATSKRLSFSQGRKLLLIVLAMTALRVALPALLTKQLPSEDVYLHYLNVRSILLHGSISQLTYYQSWPGAFIFGAMLETVTGTHSIVTLALLPVFLLTFIVLIIYLLASKLFGPRIALISAIILSNLTLPLGNALIVHFSPYLVATTMALLLIQSKMSIVGLSGRSVERSVVGLILLFAIIPTHLLTPLFAGAFMLGVYLFQRLATRIVHWVKASRALRTVVVIPLAILSLAALTPQRFTMPALLLAFFLGVSASRMRLRRPALRAIGTHLSSNYFTVAFLALTAFLFVEHRYLTPIVLSGYIGTYFGSMFKKAEDSALTQPKLSERMKLADARVLSLVSLAGISFVSAFLWWMSTDIRSFRTFSSSIEALLTEYRLEAVSPVVGAHALRVGPFTLSELWLLILGNAMTIAAILWIYLYSRRKTIVNQRAFLLAGGIITFMVTAYSLSLFRAWEGELQPFSILLGVPLLVMILSQLHKLGRRRALVSIFIFVIALTATSPLGAYTPHLQTQMFYDQDMEISKFIGEKTPYADGKLFIGDFRLFAITQYKYPGVTRSNWPQLEDFFERSLWFYGTESEAEYSFNLVDFILLSASTPHRLLYREVEPDVYMLKLNEIRCDPTIARVYDNGYDEVNAILEKR